MTRINAKHLCSELCSKREQLQPCFEKEHAYRSIALCVAHVTLKNENNNEPKSFACGTPKTAIDGNTMTKKSLRH